MAYDVKFGFWPGYVLCFTAFQPSGAGRGVPEQSLPEVPSTGYYRATSAVTLEAGDMVLVYLVEDVTYDDDLVYVSLDKSFVEYEGDRVSYEDEWVYDYDNGSTEPVYALGKPVGQGEYTSAVDTAADLGDLVENVEELVEGQSIVDLNFDDGQEEAEAEIAGGYL